MCATPRWAAPAGAAAKVSASHTKSTQDPSYTNRLLRPEASWWKRSFDVQRPYRSHLRRLRLGFVLDVGCGLGRNLAHLGGAGVGVDHNPDSVAIASARGLSAFTPEAFRASSYAVPARFDSLLLAHVAEHMRWGEARDLLGQYLSYVRPRGKIVLITPQEAGYRSDATHVEFFDGSALDRLARAVGLEPIASYSFPFPRLVGKLFKYNEFVVVARKP